MFFQRFVLACATGILAACASLQQSPPSLSANAADAFSISGRIALREHDRNLSGGIRWQHSKERDDILLLSPLGQGVMQIVRDESGATLRTADGKVYQAPDAEELAATVTGWHLPLSGLAFWVRGVQRPGSAAHDKRDEAGRLQNLVQDDWRVDYAAYSDAPNDRLPRLMTMTRPELELKLVIDDWERAPAADSSVPF
jgi:outer membrane lipoprotein LolB